LNKFTEIRKPVISVLDVDLIVGMSASFYYLIILGIGNSRPMIVRVV